MLFSSANLSTEKSFLYLMIGLHFQETYIGMKLAGRQLTILIFQMFEPKNMVILVSEQVLCALGTIRKIC